MTVPGVELKRIVEEHPRTTLADVLDGLCKARKITKSQLAVQMGCDAKVFTRMCSTERTNLKVLVAFGIVIGFNLKEIQALLLIGGQALRDSSSVDSKYMDAIENFEGKGIKRLDACNEYLKNCKIKEKYLLTFSRKNRNKANE